MTKTRPSSALRIDHIGIAVRSIQDHLTIYEEYLGLQVTGTEDLPQRGVRVAMLPVGESRVELVEPLSDDSPISRFLERRGDGLHHICFAVSDLDAALAELQAKGARLINTTPVTGEGGGRVAFLHPKGTGGILIELKEPPRGDAADA